MPGVTVKLNRVPEVLEAMRASRDRAARTLAEAIVSEADPHTPVATGSARAGWYVSAGGESNFNDRAGAAADLNPAARIVDQPETPARGSGHAIAGNVTEHAYFLEVGTAHMNAQPSLIPALEAVRLRALEIVAGEIRAALREWLV